MIEGFYFDKQGKLYSKCYYDELQDKNKINRITLQTTESLKSKLVSGRYYQLEGYINKGQNLTSDSRLQVYFRATKILKHEADVQLISKVEYDIVRERFNRDFPIIQDILLKIIENGEQPVIDVIMGINSTSEADYTNQLYDNDFYDIRHHNCNLSSQTEILEFITTYDFTETDVLIVLRGGGSGLEVFNELELCKEIIALPVPFMTGIGHHDDITLLQRVSDKAFSTPTSVGVFLQKVVNIYKERRRAIEDKDIELSQLHKQAIKEKEDLNTIIAHQRKNLKRVYIAVFLMILLIILLVYKRF